MPVRKRRIQRKRVVFDHGREKLHRPVWAVNKSVWRRAYYEFKKQYGKKFALGGKRFFKIMAKIYRQMGGKSRSGYKKINPGAPGLSNRAVDLYKKFHQFDPESIDKVKIKTRTIPKTLVKVGHLVGVIYRSDKWDHRRRSYIHRFKTKPLLVTDSIGGSLYVIGGSFKVKPEGIVG